MSKALKPEELKKMDQEVGKVAEGEARKAARGKLDEMIPFEPNPKTGEPEASIHLPNNNRARLRPNAADPIDIDISATAPTGKPVDVGAITGKKPNKDGSVTTDPRDVIDTLGKIGGVDLGKADQATQFATRRTIAAPRGSIPRRG